MVRSKGQSGRFRLIVLTEVLEHIIQMKCLKFVVLIFFSIPPAAADVFSENPAFCFGFISVQSQNETDALWHRKPHIRSLFAKFGPQDSGELTALRTKLAQNRKTEPLFDTPRFVRNLESAFHQIWDRFQTGETPRMIEVIEE